MIDAEVYVYQLGLRDLGALALDVDVRFAADIDIDVMKQLPTFTFTLTGDGQVANGDGLWSYTLTWSTFGDGMDQAKKYARIGYDLVRHWNDRPDLTVLEIDDEDVWVSSVDDIDLPSRLSSAEVNGRNVTQYTGSFALALRG